MSHLGTKFLLVSVRNYPNATKPKGYKMTRKDFELIAGVISDLMADFNNCGSDAVSLSIVAEELADALARTNDRFNRETFLKACGAN